MPDIDVLIVSRSNDSHADVVSSNLSSLGAEVFRVSLNNLREVKFRWGLNRPLAFYVDGVRFVARKRITVWWRRTGWVDADSSGKEEVGLIRAEMAAILVGILSSQSFRFVDFPPCVQLAENKLYQLSVALDLGLAVPDTIVTNHVYSAKEFGENKPLICKCVSSGGDGPSPFASRLSPELFNRVEGAPALLQEFVDASADLRIVTVGEHVFAWSRQRDASSVDWRLSDPGGLQFKEVEVRPDLRRSALAVARALNLSFSVQDWLASERGHVFLEVNPQGQWLFLEGSKLSVAPALARHLFLYEE